MATLQLAAVFMRPSTLTIARFRNRNGAYSWRVGGQFNQVRIRRNFKDREDAIVHKATLEASAYLENSELRVAITSLTNAQLRDAECAFRWVQGRPHSLFHYLDYALTTYREPRTPKPLAGAVAEYLACKGREHEWRMLSLRQLRSIRNEMEALLRQFPTGSIDQLNRDNLVAHLERGDPEVKTYNNRRGLLSTFLKFALRNDWLAENPIERTPHYRINHRRGSPKTLGADLAAELMAFVEQYHDGAMVPYFALCLFAGIRPCIRDGEISKIRPTSVNLEIGVIHIEPEVSKERAKRQIHIQPNLSAWLRAYPLERYPIIPKNAAAMHRQIFMKYGLTHDVLRHTFISMFVAKFRSIGEAALQGGNSESIVRKHYLDLKSKGEAERFFSIAPKQANPDTLTRRLD